MDVLRTPDEHFVDLPGFPFEPTYLDVDGLRVHLIDAGPRDAAPILLLHGEPTWSFLYRTMIQRLVDAGHRCVAPDLVGFGKSDKPTARAEYTYQRHVDWMRAVLLALDLREITLFGQDWGGLIGLRLAAEHEDRFARICASNTFLPTGDRRPPDAFFAWRTYSQETPVFHVGGIVKGGCARDPDPEVVAAYDAPFPDDRFTAGPRMFPMLVPVEPDDPASEPNRDAWAVLRRWEKPFLTLFGDSDPITAGADRVFHKLVPGTEGQPHETIAKAGHFIQEDAGDVLAERLISWIGARSASSRA